MNKPWTMDRIICEARRWPKTGPVDLSPGEWYCVMRGVEEILGDVPIELGNGWPIILGRKVRCKIKKNKKAAK